MMEWTEISPVVAGVVGVIGLVLTAVGTTAAVLFGTSRLLASCETRNDAAHAELGKRIDRVRTELRGDNAELRGDITELRDELRAVAANVNILVGRQQERDRAAPPAGSNDENAARQTSSSRGNSAVSSSR